MEEQSSCVEEGQLLERLSLEEKNDGNQKEDLMSNQSIQDDCITVSSSVNQEEKFNSDGQEKADQQLTQMLQGKVSFEYEDSTGEWDQPSSYHAQLIDYNVNLMTQGSVYLLEKFQSLPWPDNLADTASSDPLAQNESNQIAMIPPNSPYDKNQSYSSVHQIVQPSKINSQAIQQQEDEINQSQEPYPESATTIEEICISSQENSSPHDGSNENWSTCTSTGYSHSTSTQESESPILPSNNSNEMLPNDELQSMTGKCPKRVSKTKESFIRFYGNLSECKLYPALFNSLKMREEQARNLNPDMRLFEHLDNVKEWNIGEPIPLAEELTEDEINRIKRGILNGRLYNIGTSHLRRIFPDFISSSSLSMESQKTNNRSSIRCPLCPKTFQRKPYAYYHIESVHTMSLSICKHCRALKTSEKTCTSHRCEGLDRVHSAVLTSQESTEAESNPTIAVGRNATPIVPKKSHAGNKNSKMPGNFFVRYCGSIPGSKANEPIFRSFKRREDRIKELIPLENLFVGLESVEEWNLEDCIPPVEKLSPNDINRIKKGMANGRLYNIGHKHIRTIFPNFTALDPSEDSANSINSKRFRCPLCPKTFGSKYLIRHIEICHTKSLYICKICARLSLSSRNTSHQCINLQSTSSHLNLSETLPLEATVVEIHSSSIAGEDLSTSDSNKPTSFLVPEGPDQFLDTISQAHETSSGRAEKCKDGDRLIPKARRTQGTFLNPDKNILKGLDDFMEWNADQMIPGPGDMTYCDIMRIRKGMVNGQLYCLNIPQIKTIFPNFPQVTYSSAERNHQSPGMGFGCPLCSRSFATRKSVAGHIQKIHSSLRARTVKDPEVIKSKAHDQNSGNHSETPINEDSWRFGKRLRSGSSRSL